MQIINLFRKYQSFISYVFFGVLTTLVNVIVYWLMAHILQFGTMASTVIAWAIAVFFAYVTNRRWVFRSDASSRAAIIRELIRFFVCRLATGAIDWIYMYVFVDILHLHDVIMKASANILVIVLNYIASKLIIFRHKKEDI